MSKIKILHVIVGFIGGGVEEFLYNNIINLPKEDYDISIVAYEKSLKECIDKFKKLDIKIYELNNSNVKDIQNNKFIYNIIKKNIVKFIDDKSKLEKFIKKTKKINFINLYFLYLSITHKYKIKSSL